MNKFPPGPGVAGMIVLLATFVGSPLPAAETDENAAILETVHSAYVLGIHTDGDPAAIRTGFHERFVMFVPTDDGVRHVTRDGWIARIEEGKAAHPDAAKPQIDSRLAVLERTGDAAVVRVEIDRDGKHVYTDYMSLYRFEDGWKIVGKIYQSHD